MTVEQVLAQVKLRYPCAYTEAAQLVHLTRLENMARRDIFQATAGKELLKNEQELTIQSPYDGIYEHYLTAMLAQMDGEYTRYNAELGMYAALWSALAREQRREKMPRRKTEVRGYV